MRTAIKIIILITIPLWLIPATVAFIIAIIYFELLSPLVDEIWKK